MVAIVVLVVGADPGSSWSFGHSQVTDSDGVEIDGGGVLVVGMDPEDPLLVTALDDEPVQEDLVLRVVGPEVRKKDVFVTELGDIALEAVKRGEILGDHIVDYLSLEEDVAVDLIDADDLIRCPEVTLISASFDLLERPQAHLPIPDEHDDQVFDRLPLSQKYFFEVLIFPRAANNMPQAFSLFLLVLIIHPHVLIRQNEDFLVDLEDIQDLLMFEGYLHDQFLEMGGRDVEEQRLFSGTSKYDGVSFLMDSDDGLMRLQLVFAHGFSGFSGDEAKVVA